MELNRLYSIADKENVSVFDHKMKNKAIICEVDKSYYIGINYNDIANSREEKEVLAEELGHYYCNALYNINTAQDTIDKKECRARKWAFNMLIPFSSILNLKEKGCKYSYEFAEELGVSEDLVNEAYSYYKNNNYL